MTLLALAAAWLAGIFLGTQLNVSVPALGLFAVACVLLALLLGSVARRPLPALLLLFLVLGLLRVEALSDEPGEPLAALYSRNPVQLQGLIVADPEAAGSATRFRLAVEQVSLNSEWIGVSEDVLVTLRESAELVRQRESPYLRYGDRLLFEGALQAPPELEGFDYPNYLASQGIRSVMSFPRATLLDEGGGSLLFRWVSVARRRVADSLRRTVPEPQASLGQALLLGMRQDLPTDLVEEFRVTGTSHLLAISGLHVSVLLGLSLAVSQGVFGRRRQYYLLVPLTMVWLYALIAGMSPSVTRAAIMGSVYLAALALGRPRSVFPALGLAAALMVGLDPEALWSVSFQLSFTAMAGIALMAEPIGARLRTLLGTGPERGTPTRPLQAFVAGAVGTTFGATIATLPLVAFHFHRISLVGVPATLITLPALPAVLVIQTVAGLLGLIAPWLATPFGWLAWAPTAYITGVVGLFAGLPSASFETGRVAPLLVWAYYGALLLWYVRRPVRSTVLRTLQLVQTSQSALRLPEKDVPAWLLFPVIAIAALVWVATLFLPDGRLHVTFADVGQGDAILITTPSGKTVLVDGGPDPMGSPRLLGDRLPFWDRTIDLVLLTHPHADHVTGLTQVLRRYDVEHILERQVEYETPAYHAWRQAVSDESAQVTQAHAGQLIALGDGAFVQVLGPPETLLRGTASDVDNASVVLRLVYGARSVLLTGDMFVEAEAQLVAQGAPFDSDVLKVAHHGSRTSSSDSFLYSVTPAAAVISVSEGNRFGHPHVDTLEALLQYVPQDLLFLTSERGTIEVVTDGERLWVKTER